MKQLIRSTSYRMMKDSYMDTNFGLCRRGDCNYIYSVKASNQYLWEECNETL
jgi:hypothetical protein